MAWQLAILISIVAGVATALIRRHYAQKSLLPSTFPPAISFVFGIAPLGIIAGLILPHHVIWTGVIYLLFAILASSIALCNWLNFKSIKYLPVTQYQIISQTQVVMIIVLGWVLLNERLNLHQSLGALLLLAAAGLAILAPVKAVLSIHKGLHKSAVIFDLLGSFFGAIALVTEKVILGHMDIGAYLIFGYSVQALGILVWATKDINNSTVKLITRREIQWFATLGMANGVTGVFYVIAVVRSNNVSLIASISPVTLPLIAFGAYLFLKEKENLRLLWAALGLGIIGLLLSAH